MNRQKKNTKKETGSLRKNKVNLFFKNKTVLIILLCSITFITLSPSLNNDFVRWDDHTYITENNIIKDITLKKMKEYGNTVAGNFHPLTIFSLALDYHFFKLDPFYYHLKNLLIHLANTILVFLLIFKLSKRNYFISFFTAMIFGIHPMHVESVSWISERKDVLYSLYFLLGLLLYYEYIQKKKKIYFLLASLSFVLSVLSKSAAVVFPVVLMLIDYYENRKIKFKEIAEKTPLFLISIIFGIVALNTQSTAGAIEISDHTFMEKLQYSVLGLLDYVVKFIYPDHFNNFHPYPDLGNLRIQVLLSVIIVIGLIIIIIRYRKKLKWLFWGVGFYFITIALVLQLLQIGGSFISERYTYIPYIGLGFIYFTAIDLLIRNLPKIKFLVMSIIIAQLAFFSISAYAQTKVWKNTGTLWTNFIEKYPKHSKDPYTLRGDYYLSIGDTTKALNDYANALKLDPNDVSALIKRGKFYLDTKQFNLSLNDYENVLKQDSSNVEALIGKGAINYYIGNNEEALDLFNKALEKEKNNYFALTFRGHVHKYLSLFDKAIEDFDSALKVKPDYLDAINGKKEVTALLNDDTEMYKVYFNRAGSLANKGNYSKAIEEYTKVISLKEDHHQAYFLRARCFMYLKQYKPALNDLNTAIKIEPNIGEYYHGRAFMYGMIGQKDSALKDIKKAENLGVIIDKEFLNSLQKE